MRRALYLVFISSIFLMLLFIYIKGNNNPSLKEVEYLNSDDLLCDIGYGPLILDPSKTNDFCTMIYRYAANPLFPITSMAQCPNEQKFYVFTKENLFEFKGNAILIRQISILDFNLPSGKNVFKYGSSISNDTLWFVVQNSMQNVLGEINDEKNLIIQWNLEQLPSESVIGPEIDSDVRWSVDSNNHAIIPFPVSGVYDFINSKFIKHNWPEMHFVDYKLPYGLLFSSGINERIKSIIHLDITNNTKKELLKGKCAFWGSDGKIFYFKTMNEIWCCDINGENAKLIYSTGGENQIVQDSVSISNDNKFIAFFYRNQTNKQERGIVVIDLNEWKFHKYDGIGFGNILWLQRNNKTTLQETLEKDIMKIEKLNLLPHIELHDVVLQWPKSFVLWLINYTKDINSIDTLMRTPLHYAAEIGRSDIVELLLSKGATPNFKDINGNTPLHLAVEGPSYNYCEPSFAMSQEDCIKILLKYGGDPNIKNDLGQTPKDIALQFPEKNYLAFLLSPSNEQLSSLNLLDAIRKNNFKLAEALINSSIDVNQKDKNGESPLEAAWFMGKKFIDLLVENGADVNQYFRDGLTPLQHAVIQEDEEIVRLLLDKGAVLNKKSKNGYTALDFAEMRKTNKTKDIIRILEEHGE